MPGICFPVYFSKNSLNWTLPSLLRVMLADSIAEHIVFIERRLFRITHRLLYFSQFKYILLFFFTQYHIVVFVCTNALRNINPFFIPYLNVTILTVEEDFTVGRKTYRHQTQTGIFLTNHRERLIIFWHFITKTVKYRSKYKFSN